MKIKRYYILEHKGRTIDITRDMLTLGPMPVLWCNGGMYALIPGAILEIMFDITSEKRYRPHAEKIWWEQAYKLPQAVGRLLCDQGYNQASNEHD